tara:strand:+ start:9883 stop:11166 length:1284 start_codon:yes stop_codon:yes gene_type:complete
MFTDPSEHRTDHAVCAFTLSDNQISPDVSETLDISHDMTDQDIRDLRPALPVPLLMPDVVQQKTADFVRHFTGHVMYAVKCNPDHVFLDAIYQAGVRHFDVASIGEIRRISARFPDAVQYFMHPIKAPEAIREAYINHGVRAYVLDYDGELEKIRHETNDAPDLELIVRLAIPKKTEQRDVATDFSSKFGAQFDQAVNLLKACRPHCAILGVSFHVGTQCQDPDRYAQAVAYAARVIEESGVVVETLDVGGGFPADLESATPLPPVQAFTQSIADAVSANGLNHMHLLCEVGRGLVAGGGALIVRVEGRKEDLLYLNDGTYGGLFEAGGAIGLPYPAHLIRREERAFQGQIRAFRFAGPTCDSVDMMQGPFMLPEDVQVGDWIRLDQLGAYGEVSRTDFNGFGAVQKIILRPQNAAPTEADKTVIHA